MKDDEKKKAEKMAKGERKYSLQAGIAGQSSGIFKGASPIPKMVQLKIEINQFIKSHVQDSYGVLIKIMEQKINQNDLLIATHSEMPLGALKEILERILSRDDSLFEFVRQIDQQYGVNYQERPHFQKEGQEAHPDDEYTHESVRMVLEKLLNDLE